MGESRFRMYTLGPLWMLAVAVLLLTGCSGRQPTEGSSAATPPPEQASKKTTSDSPVGNEVGNRAPDFSLPTGDGKTVSLADYRGKPIVLVFYRGYW